MGKDVGNRDERRDVGNDEQDDSLWVQCSNVMMPVEGMSKHVDVFEIGQACTLSPSVLEVFINGMIVAEKAARQGVQVGKYTVSGVMFRAGSETLEGSQKQKKSAAIHKVESDNDR